MRVVGLGAAVLIAAAAGAYFLLRGTPPPPPAEVAADPLLLAGREIYLARCVGCHGETGHGDGPIAKGLKGPRVRDLTSPEWKYGERPDQVLSVLREGTRDSAMPGWGKTFDEGELRGVAAYVYYLGERRIPPELRRP